MSLISAGSISLNSKAIISSLLPNPWSQPRAWYGRRHHRQLLLLLLMLPQLMLLITPWTRPSSTTSCRRRPTASWPSSSCAWSSFSRRTSVFWRRCSPHPNIFPSSPAGRSVPVSVADPDPHVLGLLDPERCQTLNVVFTWCFIEFIDWRYSQ